MPSSDLRALANDVREAALRHDWAAADEGAGQLIWNEPARVEWRMLRLDTIRARWDLEPDPELHFGREKAARAAAAQASPTDALAWFELGYAWLRFTGSFVPDDEDLARAEQAFERARGVNPYCLAGYVGLKLALNKRSLAGQHQYDQATAVCQEAVGRLPDDAEAWFHLGESYYDNYDRNMKADALLAYQRAVVLDPGYVAAHFKIASIERIMHHFPEAIASYNRVIELDERSTFAKDARRSLVHIT